MLTKGKSQEIRVKSTGKFRGSKPNFMKVNQSRQMIFNHKRSKLETGGSSGYDQTANTNSFYHQTQSVNYIGD